ncbi:KPN_02809 family neutral zinc metallopeptidase [Lutibaculum baratangense]|uniref:YpfJ protein, zinc metalloprotease superfamily n=1 Tax=Lutibaculum baratangense AMV1 TaxID=631454 RepID=V4RV60_9HYPH|nr:neutral zinc metallopeptidase [Lutibaculum baratangense]ESR26915.1 YpfJ protein, zinc metalloprotease superfamily [Lutibaculum baratangense AMV1]
MRWRGRRGSANVEDRRGRGGFGRMAGGGMRIPVGRGGVGGLGFIAVVLVVSMLLGVNPLALLEGLDGGPQPPGQTRTTEAQDELSQFASVVLADTEDTWNRIFERMGEDYPEPTLVLFSGAVASACGSASSAVGPFYCGGDQRLYLDLDFFSELRRRFEAPGDFAQAYVIAHEVGHHVQNVLGILGRYQEVRRGLSESDANALSVRVELQADCFAGVWAHDTQQKGLLEEGDIDEALNAAAQIGDDAIQERTRGYVVPDSFNHGTSEQRARWFRTGLEQGSLDACDTFEAERL